MYPSICLSICLSDSLSVCLSVYLVSIYLHLPVYIMQGSRLLFLGT